MLLVKVKAIKSDVIYVNPKHIISIRESGRNYHVSLTDFGFDISREEFGKLINNCTALIDDSDEDY